MLGASLLEVVVVVVVSSLSLSLCPGLFPCLSVGEQYLLPGLALSAAASP